MIKTLLEQQYAMGIFASSLITSPTLDIIDVPLRAEIVAEAFDEIGKFYK